MAVKTKRSCAIATTPRSGSWLLADAMHATGVLGEPQEYFSVEAGRSWAKTFGLAPKPPLPAYLEGMLAYGTDPAGLFSVKVHWQQLEHLARRARSLPGRWPRNDVALLARLLPDVHFVHLYRRDTARQAISYWRALQTKTWWDQPNGPRQAPSYDPDFQQIRFAEDMLVGHEERWRELIERTGRPSIDVVYEDLVADREGVIEAIADLLGVTAAPAGLPEPSIGRQSDETTEEWLTAYRAIRDQLRPLPADWSFSPAVDALVPADPADALPAPPVPRPWRPTPTALVAPRRPYGSAPELSWYMRYVLDEYGEETGFVAIRGPLDGDEVRLLHQLARSRRVIGWTSYGPFPRVHPTFDGLEFAEHGVRGPERAYLALCEAWVHCFRHPDRYLLAGVPRLFLSESDFFDPDCTIAEIGEVDPSDKRWDVIYVCCPNDFNELTKNWRLARRCIARLATELGTTALLVGRDQAPDVPEVTGVDVCDELPWDELMGRLARARVLLVPNVLDASPLLIVEALSLGVPVVVNEQLLGGWKYVTPETGLFFHDEHDVVPAVADLLADARSPREWLVANVGPKQAELRLASFLRRLPPRDGWHVRPFGRAHLSGDVWGAGS